MPALTVPTLNELRDMLPRSLPSHQQATALGHHLITRNDAMGDIFTLPVILGVLVAVIFAIGLGCMIKICITPDPYAGAHSSVAVK